MKHKTVTVINHEDTYTHNGDDLRFGTAPEDPKLLVVKEGEDIVAMYYGWVAVAYDE